MGLWLEWIPEEDEHVEAALGHQRPDLEVAAERTALQLEDAHAELLLQQRPGRARGDEVVPGQDVTVVDGPLHEVALLVVVRDQADALADAASLLHGRSSQEAAGVKRSVS